MPREILVHLNVELSDSDERTADEVADAIVAAAKVDGAVVVCPMAEEV